ncbi:MAG TPA: ABC transporter ATP-binding protein [Ktedonobacteraceae bacterium]|jgi:branched-chain amino acid transport system ATP-binding protein|nr:ABC transporter ATP-binding protein [Ktedonobacteraceae bacterium]
MLKLANVVAGYGGGDVLQGVDLEIEKGSLTCLVGPNGAGKSTVLRVISGLLKPRRGAITFNGQSIIGMTTPHILQLGIAQIAQEHSLFPDMTVQENMELGGQLLRNRQRIEQRLRQIEERFPLVKERAKELTRSLSGGQQRQIEIARALMLDPTLVLVDEPSMSLDPKTLVQVFETIQQMHSAGTTVLLVEQNVRSGLAIATHGVVMESGRVRMKGLAEQVREDPEMGRMFFGGALSET